MLLIDEQTSERLTRRVSSSHHELAKPQATSLGRPIITVYVLFRANLVARRLLGRSDAGRGSRGLRHPSEEGAAPALTKGRAWRRVLSGKLHDLAALRAGSFLVDALDLWILPATLARWASGKRRPNLQGTSALAMNRTSHAQLPAPSGRGLPGRVNNRIVRSKVPNGGHAPGNLASRDACYTKVGASRIPPNSSAIVTGHTS